MTGRRSFLLQGVSGVAALCVTPLAMASSDPDARKLADARFSVWKNGDPVARLQWVWLRESTADARLQQFTLRFHADPSTDLEEACHELHHQQYGSVVLFLQPAGQSSVRKEFSATVCLFAGQGMPGGLPEIDELRSLITL